MSKEKSIEATEIFTILSETINGANFDDLCDATHMIVHSAGYRKQSEGEWIVEKFKNGDMFINCSACKSVIDCNYTNIDENEFDFCPYCGAKMKGGTE